MEKMGRMWMKVLADLPHQRLDSELTQLVQSGAEYNQL